MVERLRRVTLRYVAKLNDDGKKLVRLTRASRQEFLMSMTRLGSKIKKLTRERLGVKIVFGIPDANYRST